MAGEVDLRPVPVAGEHEEPPQKLPRPPSRRWLWLGTSMALGTALALALGWLTWTRIELGERIVLLEEETRSLRAAVVARERVIGAQGARLDDVRDHVERLGALLAQPIE